MSLPTYAVKASATSGRIPLWATLAAFGAVALFATAGRWQLDRAAQKRAELQAFSAGSAPARGLPDDGADGRYRVVRLEGRYDAGHQVLLDNMTYQGRAGVQVLTPLVTSTGTVLVNRGWLPASGDRERIPDIAVGTDPRAVVGRLDRLPRPGLRLAPESPRASAPWPRRLAFPTIAELRDQLETPVYAHQLLLDPDQPDGFARDWVPSALGPERHLSYALQWFALAAAVAGIWLYFQVKSLRVGHR